MLYPQQRERENRFKLALRTAIPTFLLIIMLFVLFLNKDDFLLFFSLLVGAALIIAYYNLHVIYSGFNENMMDTDTDVFNFSALKNIIENEVKRATPHTLMMIKIGDLESINAHYGRELVNSVLRETIRSLMMKIEEAGFKRVPVGYCGGGQFLLLLKKEIKEVNSQLSPLLARVKTYYVDDIELEIDSAIVTLQKGRFDEQTKTLIDLINTPHFDTIAFKDDSSHDFQLKALEHRIREAIEKESLSLQYQNVYSTKEQKIDIIEFSAKLIDRNNKFIHHSDIMPVVNRLGLEKSFYLLVLKKIMRLVFEKKITLKFSIAISAFALRHKEIRSEIPLLMREYEIKPSQMILAVMEEHYYKHVERYQEIINHYRSAGVNIAFTNIGSNSPALEYLKFMQIDYIKYDRFFATSHADRMPSSVYDGLDLIMRQRGIKRWAIMVEDETIENILKAKEIDFLQGWQIGKYNPVESINKELKEIR